VQPGTIFGPIRHQDGNKSDNQDEVKRKHFLERNRQAACKSRQKRKVWIKEMEDRANDLTEANSDLHVMVAGLRDEVSRLRSILVSMAQGGCQCPSVHKVLSGPAEVENA